MNQLCCSQDMCGRPERSPCCEGEYIIERVIGKNRQKCCYQGILPIENSGTFCPPLFLKEIEVIDIATICPTQPCSCGTQQLRLTLLLRSIDGRGCRFQSYAEVQIEVCEGTNRPTVCKTNVRRGATVCIRLMLKRLSAVWRSSGKKGAVNLCVQHFRCIRLCHAAARKTNICGNETDKKRKKT